MNILYEPRGRAREYAALAANLYAGCVHGCEYCYVPACVRRDRADFHGSTRVRAGALAALDKDASKTPKGARVLLSFTTDPCQPGEEDRGVTREAIRILHAHGLAVEILTKGGTRARHLFPAMRAGDAFASTLTFTDPAQSAEWEPGAALPEDRLAAMHEAHDLGIETWASLEPVIDPAQSLALIDQAAPFTDLFKLGTLNHHPHAATIDWAGYARRAVAAVTATGRKMYVKDDLRRFLA